MLAYNFAVRVALRVYFAFKYTCIHLSLPYYSTDYDFNIHCTCPDHDFIILFPAAFVDSIYDHACIVEMKTLDNLLYLLLRL